MFDCCQARKKDEETSTSICLTKYASDFKDAIKVYQIILPKLGPDDILISVRAASLNNCDWRIAEGHLKSKYFIQFPYILGRDFAGVIDKIGINVTSFERKDKVYGIIPYIMNGSFTEYIVINQNYCCKMPNNLAYIKAASIPYTCVKIYQNLINLLSNKPKQKIVITPAWNDPGFYALKLARVLGAYVIAEATDESMSFLLNGANVTFDFTRYPPSLNTLKEILDMKDSTSFGDLEELENACDIKFIDIILHLDGEFDITPYVRYMKDTTVILSLSEDILDIPLQYKERVVKFRFEPNSDDLFKITDMINKDVLSVYSPLTYSLKEISIALNKMKNGNMKHDKYVLRMDLPKGDDEYLGYQGIYYSVREEQDSDRSSDSLNSYIENTESNL